ncbi:cation:proton antiporter [Pelagibius sp.]|uniref:cation:proton antiporter n=1 Tax=Pelagibius sp. TaxID=1931238 RepID=UPI003B5130C6
MEGHTSSITELAIVVVAALCCGLVVRSFRQPILLGYILAGAALGPSGLGLVENRDQVQLLAELGVLMLLFFIGMELQLRSLKAVWRIALMTTLFQIAVGVLAMSLLGFYLDWPIGLTVVLGFVVALSSTAIAIKMLEEIGEKGTRVGNVTIGILIAQDLAVIPMMLVVSTFTGGNASIGAGTLIKLVLSIAFLAILLVYLGRGRRLRLPFAKSVGRNVDLTPLAGLAFCFGAAALAGLMELSASYGAFLAGLVIGNSTSRRVMMHYTAPIQSVLLMVFFLTIGLLMDLGYIWENLGTVVLIVTFVAILKTALNIVVIRAMGETWPRAFLSGVMLAQLGEFSFILAALGLTAGVISPEEHRLLVAVTVLSLIGSPIWLEAARRLHRIALLGITSGRETLRLTLGPEAMALGRSGGRIGGRIGDWLRLAAKPLLPETAEASRRDQKPLAPDAGSDHDSAVSAPPRRSPAPPLNPGAAEAD